MRRVNTRGWLVRERGLLCSQGMVMQRKMIAFVYARCSSSFDFFMYLAGSPSIFCLPDIQPQVHLFTSYEMVFSTMVMPYFSFSSFMSGSVISVLIGAKIPFSLIWPLRTCFTATAHGTPTVLAMAE